MTYGHDQSMDVDDPDTPKTRTGVSKWGKFEVDTSEKRPKRVTKKPEANTQVQIDQPSGTIFELPSLRRH